MRINIHGRWVLLPMVCLLVATLGLIGCNGNTSVAVGGSTTVQPLTEKWRDAYEANHEDIDVTVEGGGSTAGVAGVSDGRFDIGAISRDLKSSEKEQWPELVDHAVAYDGVAIVVHPSNPNGITDITLEEIANIFEQGSTSTWTVVSREEGSGTRETFENRVMGDMEIASSAEFQTSNGAIKQKVANTENAIGYLSLGYVDDSVQAITVDGIECAIATVQDSSYPIARILYLVTWNEPEGEIKDFIDFAKSSEGQQIVEDEGYIAII
ncbi:MAG: phosphate ABC transporter substrate-binding protein [Chloroflexota bacterium]|nr:phosphate ABC transporter substrate-binding protein [Chloroflexota bacterium]